MLQPDSPTTSIAPVSTAEATSTNGAPLHLRRLAMPGPRCPDCTGPLVFGEGCRLCPVCGYSACGA